MKTNVVLRSSDRSLFGVTIRQETKSEMLSVSDLQKAYKEGRIIHNWSDRILNHITSGKDFRERVYFILKERDFIKVEISVFMKTIEKDGIIKVLKGLGLWKTTGRGANKQTVADPYIWVLVAMEMSPLIYAKVVIWLTDSLIFNRIEAGTEYLPMNAAIKKIIENPNYPMYAKAINFKVFGKHLTGIRNTASSEQLRKIAYIERFTQNCIDSEFVKTEKEIITLISNVKIKL